MKISAAQYAEILFELTQKKSQSEIGAVISEFAKLLRKNKQFNLINKIIEKFDEIWNEKHGIVLAEITSVRELGKELEEKIKNFIKRKYQAREIILNIEINENIRGGIIMKAGNEIIDASLARQLENLKSFLEK